jgi:hypothetical protein
MRLSKSQIKALVWARDDVELVVTGMDARPVKSSTCELLERKGLIELSQRFQGFTSVNNQCISYRLTEAGKNYFNFNQPTQG